MTRTLATCQAALAALAALTLLAACAARGGGAAASAAVVEDPYLWLEDIEGERALDWVRTQNARSLPALENDPRYPQLLNAALEVAQSRERLPLGEIRGY